MIICKSLDVDFFFVFGKYCFSYQTLWNLILLFFYFLIYFFDREEGGFIMMALRNDKIVLYNVFMLNIPIFSFISVASLASVVEQVVETRI